MLKSYCVSSLRSTASEVGRGIPEKWYQNNKKMMATTVEWANLGDANRRNVMSLEKRFDIWASSNPWM